MKKKASQNRNVSIPVGVVRDLEKMLIKTSKDRKLNTHHRVQLRKYADLLSGERKAAGRYVRLNQKIWLVSLKCLSWVMRQQVFRDFAERMMGDK